MSGMSEIQALDLQPGDSIGGYTLINRLGGGAMGSVWKVKDDGGQLHAMKILRDSLSDEGNEKGRVTSRERLRREAMALRKINNPGICGIDDMELDDSVAFIVTELIEGENLREDVAHNGRYVGEDLERLASKLIAAVQAVHAAGIIHRDIKPTNVMISVSGPILVDFGIAMGQGESHVTSTGLVMGTPGFIAPEIIDGAESDEMTDWWSVASVLAFAATGAPVYGTSPMMAVLEREASGNANLAGLPPRTLAAFRSALNPDRSKRCTPQELLNAITKDAWTRESWESSDSDAMLPFGKSDPGETGAPGPARYPNARLIWRAREARTTALKTPPPPPPSPTRTLNSQQFSNAPATRTMQSTPMHSDMSSERNATLPLMNTVAQPVQPPTAVLTPPPIRVVESQRNMQSAPPEDAQMEPSSSPIAPPVAQQWETVKPSINAFAAPAVDPRSRYLSHGTLVGLLIAIPLAIFATVHPLLSAGVAGLLFWLFSAIGLNIAAQSQREFRRGGTAKFSDGMLRVLAFPAHLFRGLGHALPAIGIGLLINVCISAIALILLRVPLSFASWPLPGITLHIPVPYGSPLSMGGLAVALGATAGWIIGCYCPSSTLLRTALGSLRGKIPSPSASTSDGGTNTGTNTVATVWLSIWIVITAVVVFMMLTTGAIDWAPWIV